MDLASGAGGAGAAPKLGAAAGGVADGNEGTGGAGGEAPSAVRSESIFLGKSVLKLKEFLLFLKLGGVVLKFFVAGFVKVCWL